MIRTFVSIISASRPREVKTSIGAVLYVLPGNELY